MTERVNDAGPKPWASEILDDLCEEITAKVQAGEQLDLEAYVRRFPEHEDQFRELVRAVESLADLGISISSEGSRPARRLSSQPVTGVLGDFRIVGEIGRGGMGVVYEAEQISLGRRVALKVLPFAALVDPKQLQRFQNEARAAASLDHPNIVQVFSVGCERAVHFYAMQYIEGQTLARVIAELRQTQEPEESEHDLTAVSELTRLFLAENDAEESRPSTLAPVGRGQGEGALNKPAGTLAPVEAAEEVGPACRAGPGNAESLGIRGPARQAGPTFRPQTRLVQQPPQGRGQGEGVADDDPPAELPTPADDEGAANAEQVPDVEGVPGVDGHRREALVGEPPEADTRREPQAAVSTEGTIRTAAFFRSVARLGIQAAEALEHAHQLGVVHRDVKPSNLILDTNGKVWISDFGLAQTQTGANITISGDILGTLRYMSPEQAEGNRRILDHHTDIYSLGVTLYELLTLQTPFDSDDRHQLIHQIIDSDPRPPRGLNPTIPRDLETTVLKAMAAEPEGRYTTAQELADDLRRFLEHKPIRARRPSLPARFAKWSRRHQPIVWSAVATLVICIVALALSTVQITGAYKSEKTHRHRAVEQQGLAEAAAEKERQARTEADRNLYVAQVRLAQHDWEAGQISRLKDMLDGQIPGPDDTDLRGWEWYYFLSLCHRDLLTLRGHYESVFSVAWSPDGKQIASAGKDQSIRIWDVATQRVVVTLRGHSQHICSLAWSPQGKRLASGSADGTARIWDLDTGQALLCLRGHTNCVRVSWHQDGMRLASGCSDGNVRIWDATTGVDLLTFRAAGGDVGQFQLAWSPDGTRLACGGGSTIEIWDAAIGQRAISWPTGYFTGRALAWSPDSTRLASGSYEQYVKIWDPHSGQELLSIRDNSAVRSVAWNPDGNCLASATQGQKVQIWNSVTGENIQSLRGHAGTVDAVAWNRDGTLLASAGRDDETIKIWDPLREQEVLTLAHSESLPTILNGGDFKGNVAWSPRGDRLASCGAGMIKIWDLKTEQPVQSLESPAELVAWNPDGIRLAVLAEGQIAILDAETCEEVFTLERIDGTISIAWSPDGNRLAAARGSTWVVWDASTWKEVLSADAETGKRGAKVWAIAWSPDARRLASADWDGEVKIWNVATGRKIHTLPHVSAAWFLCSLAWSPDGMRLASGGEHEAIKIWDTHTGRELQSLRGHTGLVSAPLAWSPDGQRLASGGRDGAVKVWNPSAGQELLSLHAYADTVGGLAWSPDGLRLAAIGGAEGRIKIWDASPGYQYVESPAHRMERARRLTAKGRYDEAISILEKDASESQGTGNYRDELAHAYSNRGEVRLNEGRFDKAIADYTQALSLSPNLVDAYRGRGNSHAELGQWKEARDDFETAMELGYDPVAYRPALLCLAAGDRGGYLNACRQMLDRSDDINRSDAAGVAAATCILAPNAVADFDRPIQWAERAVNGERRKWSLAYGAILYRAGRWEEAIQRLSETEEILASHDRRLGAIPAYTWFFLTMVHHRLRHTQEAVTLFDKAVEWADGATGPADLSWDERVLLHLLRQEAEELLKTQAPEISDLPAPEAAQAYYSRGRVRATRGEYDQAIADYSEAIRLKPEAAEYYRYRAEVHEKLDQRDKAIEDYSQAIKLNPDDARTYVYRSKAHRGKGDYAKAIDDCTSALSIDPKLSVALVSRAIAYRVSGDLDQALEDTNTGLLAAPGDVGLLHERATIYARLKHWDKAFADYEEAIRLAPRNHHLYRGRARAHVQLKQWDKAIADCDQAMKLRPNDAEACLQRGNCCLLSGNLTQAVVDYSKCLELLDDQGPLRLRRDAFRLRGEAYLGLGRYDEALADCNKYVELGPDDEIAALIRAQMLLTANRTEDYRQACVDMLDRFGQSNPHRKACAAWACVLAPKAISDPMRAVDLAKDVLASRPKNPCYIYIVGMAHFRAGQLEEAAQRLHESLASPNSRGIFPRLGLALVHHQRGETEKALEWLGRAVEWMEQHIVVPTRNRIQVRLLRREVEQLLGKPAQESDAAESEQGD